MLDVDDEVVIIEKTMTSIEKTVFWRYFIVLCELVKSNLFVNELEYGLGFIAAEKNTANNRQT